MERIRNLTGYQKALIIIMIVMVMVFSIIYPKTVSRVGFWYNDRIFVPSRADGSTVYSGRLDGNKARFVLSDYRTVVFYYGDTTYGPYSLIYDPTAVPESHSDAKHMTGIEIRDGEDIKFRGGIIGYSSSGYFMYDEHYRGGSIRGVTVGKSEKDSPAPNNATIMSLINGPTITHKGQMSVWAMCTLACILNALSIIFVDDLFVFFLSLRIDNAEQAEPSHFELTSRSLSWAVLTIVTLIAFILGLQ